MHYKQNLHTHTTYCDGNDTPREIVEAAIKKGFDSIGFSGHSILPWPSVSSMPLEETELYCSEINQLKEEYKNKIQIFCGIEFDRYSDFDVTRFDYAIGSAHFLRINGKYVAFDRTQSAVEEVLQTYFANDGMAYAKMYYETLAQLPQCGKFDIVGHFDLIAKHSENIQFFDEHSKEYMGYAVEAAKELRGTIPYFEVNTGAMARGYRTTPYPSVPLMRELKRLGFEPVISSDCHNAALLDYKFEQAEEQLKYCGFDYSFVLTTDGFKPIKL